ncbi:hypothetical protein ABDK00_001520 [Niabella insulamsoli]|uniref:hypothetical protein n=1 Tax=Niabella insulamsoli TaxID=3144874 RepID=UPI003CCC55CF
MRLIVFLSSFAIVATQAMFFVLRAVGSIHWPWYILLIPFWVYLIAGISMLVAFILFNLKKEVSNGKGT